MQATPTHPEGYLSLVGIDKSFGATHVVRGLDLSVNEGEFISLLGPSGCGKTTTLQMIAGFEEPTQGRIHLAGRDITRLPANERQIGVVFQNYALFPHMSVAQNVTFGLDLRKVDAAAKAKRLGELLELVALSGLQERYPRQLSGGQQQRVAIARALAIEPRVLLLDEPFSNLDARLRGGMQSEVKRLQRETGITAVLVTHDQSEAMSLSDRLAIMRQGKIIQIDAPQTAYDQPRSAYVGNFLGNTNLLKLPILRRDDRTVTVSISQQDTAVAAPPGSPTEPLLISLRPERVRFEPQSSDIKIQGRIRSREFHGSVWQFETDTELGPVTVSVAHEGFDVPVEGTVLPLHWSSTDMRAVYAD